jgi:hypothetical protein
MLHLRVGSAAGLVWNAEERFNRPFYLAAAALHTETGTTPSREACIIHDTRRAALQIVHARGMRYRQMGFVSWQDEALDS